MVAEVGARVRAQAELVALAELLGAGVWYEGIHMGITFPTSHANARGRLGFDATSVRRSLEGADPVLLVGGSFFEEVWFDAGSPFPDGTAVIQIADAPERLARNFPVRVGLLADPARALRALREAVEAGLGPAQREAAARRNAELAALRDKEAESQRSRAARRWDREPLSMPRVMAELAATLPPDAIVVDEAITAGPDLARTLAFARPGDYWGARGGGIGQALPGALGVKLAHPDRPVVAVSGDGSAMYSIQALWTAAHHDIGAVFVILSNREYRILKHNMDVLPAALRRARGAAVPAHGPGQAAAGLHGDRAGHGRHRRARGQRRRAARRARDRVPRVAAVPDRRGHRGPRLTGGRRRVPGSVSPGSG